MGLNHRDYKRTIIEENSFIISMGLNTVIGLGLTD